MSQIFHHSTNALARASIVVGVIALGVGGGLLDRLSRSSYVTGQGEERQQPVPFYHAHHVGDVGIDCRYCHGYAETEAYAGIPPTKTCMNCHSQIWSDSPTLEPVRASFRDDKPLVWKKVHDLPDFAYFNHSAHVNKGVGCTTCHGRVDRMAYIWQEHSLQMEWCLECHRAPERFVRPREEVFNPAYEPPPDQLELGRRLVEEYGIQARVTCSTCHR
jgi:hypothetical protein